MKLLFILIAIALFSCRTMQGKKYGVKSVTHLRGNAYLIKTDSFSIVRFTKGMGKFHPDSITIKQ